MFYHIYTLVLFYFYSLFFCFVVVVCFFGNETLSKKQTDVFLLLSDMNCVFCVTDIIYYI